MKKFVVNFSISKIFISANKGAFEK